MLPNKLRVSRAFEVRGAPASKLLGRLFETLGGDREVKEFLCGSVVFLVPWWRKKGLVTKTPRTLSFH